MPERPPDLGRKRPIFFIPLDNRLDGDGLQRISTRTIRRHDPLEMEKAGAQLLLARLYKMFDVEIEYNPESGLLYVANLDGSLEFTAFGRLAEQLEETERVTGLSFQELSEHALDRWKGYEEAFRQGEDVVRDSRTGKNFELPISQTSCAL
jgi:hypothetical protein